MLKIFKRLHGTLKVKSIDMKTKELLLDGETRYLVSSDGTIYRFTKSKSNNKEKCSYVTTKNGYKKTCIFGKEEYVHRIIAELFCDNKDNLATVNHKDGNKFNNMASNLEWLTYSDNHSHSYRELGRVAGMKGRRRGRGVCFDKSRGKWMSYADLLNGRKYIGRFDTEAEAFEALESFKGDNAVEDVAKAMAYKKFRGEADRMLEVEE